MSHRVKGVIVMPVGGVEVLAYCLMRNHYHLCLRTPGGNLARVMRVYTQRVNRAQGRDGPLFRGRYKAVAKVYGVTGARHRSSRGEVRQAVMYFVSRLCGWTLQATAEHFGLTSYGGVNWACAQIWAKQAGERTLRNTLEHIEQQILQQQT